MSNTYRLSDYTFRGRDYLFGWLRFDGQRDLGQTCIMHERDGLVRVTVPYTLEESEVSSWFLPDWQDVDDEQNVVSLPSKLRVEEIETGRVFSLIGCRTAGTAIRGDSHNAYGLLAPRFVIAGDAVGDYETVSMTQSCSLELFRWIGLPSATLLLAVDEVCRRFPASCTYLPVYEMFMDELRDYRFYAPDMLHPSEVAVDIVWRRIVEHCMSERLQHYLRDYEPIRRALNHRPTDPESEAYHEFLRTTMREREKLMEKYECNN